MKIAASYLSVKDKLEEKIEMLDNSNIDYIHVDVMDGVFVPNKTYDIDYVKEILNGRNKKLDVHLMVSDICKYINDYKVLNPEFITFHLEATEKAEDIINYIKSLNIKVGISINPNTSIEKLIPYLDKVDLVLIMSVEPGLGGQSFIDSSIYKINNLRKLNDKVLIEVDGGINDINIKKINADIAVVGSFITNSNNYEEKIKLLKN